MPRVVHTGIHRFEEGCCVVCTLTPFAVAGRQCSGIRGQLGRLSQDLPAGVALGPPTELADHGTGQSGSNGGAPRPGKNRRRGISPASPAQRLKVRELACIVCGKDRYEATVDPAHLVPRSLLTEGQDDPLAIVPLCRLHHDEFDRASLDLLPYLWPAYAAELGEAVRHFGILPTLRQVTGQRWVPVESAA